MKTPPSEISEIIEMAWCDKTSFDDILEITALSEKDVIQLMRSTLKPSSFRLWRKRVSGRVKKHRTLFNQKTSQEPHPDQM